MWAAQAAGSRRDVASTGTWVVVVTVWGGRSLMAVDYTVYAELGADQIRKALQAHPRNVANLCRYCR